jgi:DNA recombination protein RmuC
MEIVLIIAALLIGSIIAYLWLGSQNRNRQKQLEEKIIGLQNEKLDAIHERDSRIAVLTDRLTGTLEERDKIAAEAKSIRDELTEKLSIISRMQAIHEQMLERFENQKKELAELQQKFAVEFENLANKLFKQHSQDFVQTSGKNLNELINPLKDRLKPSKRKYRMFMTWKHVIRSA